MATPNAMEKEIWMKLFVMGVMPPVTGNVFYVHNWTGSDVLNDGLTPATPLATIGGANGALSRCVNDNDDYIIVLQHYQELPIAVNVTLVHIIGLGANPAFPFVCLNNALNNDAIFTLTALSNHVEIAGFMLSGGAGHGCIENVAGTVQQPYIHNCVFGHSFSNGANTPQDGILIAQGCTCPVIENCTFIGTEINAGGFLARDGIRFAGAQPTMLNGAIRNCTFLGLDGVGINIDTPFNGGVIKNNVFAVPDLAVGEAIDIAVGATGGTLIDGNHAFEGMVTPTGFDPYQDLTAGGNHWGQNTRGIAAPAIPS